jgi:predicted AlkP superfamily phosphohydrolase/phosphomutase
MLAVFVMDCAEPAILERLAADGRMPTLASLVERGTSVTLASDADTLDGSVFQTLLTGVNPGEHGIYKYVQLVPGTYRYASSKAESSPVPQLWTVFSRSGKECCVFDVPKLFPAEGFRGMMVSAWGAYTPAAAPASIPPDLRAAITRRFGPHSQRRQLPLPLSPSGYEAVRDRLVRGARVRADICRHLLSQGRWDFFMTAFCESHVASHQFWQLRDPGHPMFDAASAARCADAMEHVYAAIDEAVGRIIEELPRDATIVLMTQQGVENNYSGSHLLPEWLALRNAGGRRPVRRGPLHRVAAALSSQARLHIGWALPHRVAMGWLSRKYPGEGDVFMLPGSEFMALLRVNLEGREPRGAVPLSRYREVLERLREDLLALRNASTGSAAVEDMILPHAVYRGRRVDNLPDAIVKWRNDAPIRALQCPQHGTISKGVRFLDLSHSSHTGTGLAVIAGPGIPHGRTSAPRPLVDLTATFYSLLREAVPPHLEGKAIAL